MSIRQEHVEKLQREASRLDELQRLGLDDGPNGAQTRARFEALRRNASASEWVTARETSSTRCSDVWR